MSDIRRTLRILVIGCGALIIGACAGQPGLREELDRYPVKHLEFYDFDPTTELMDRVTDAPAELLSLYSNADGVDLRPLELTTEQLGQVRLVLAMLPERHQAVLKSRLIGIYCVENFLGSGMADWILGPTDEIYAVLVLHPRVFELSAAELLTFRANTAFRAEDPNVSLSVELSQEISALAYIVLHESTHIVDYVERHTPYVEPAMLELLGRSKRDTSFTERAWTDYYELAPEIDFDYQQKLQFYGLGGDPPLSSADIEAVCRALVQTPFASLYGSTSWAEDFADFVTFHYLVRGLGVDYSIRVARAGSDDFAYAPMDSPVVTGRARLVDPGLLKPPGVVQP